MTNLHVAQWLENPTTVWKVLGGGGGGEVLPENLGGSVWSTPWNPYPISDQNM